MNAWNFQELKETPSQTGGPYVHIGLLPQQANIEVFENNFNNQLVKEKTKVNVFALKVKYLTVGFAIT
jgi:protocatechuate 3,4-dioxygenase alpha subunit